MVGGAAFRRAKTTASVNAARIITTTLVVTHVDSPNGPSIANATNRLELGTLDATSVTMVSTSSWVRQWCREEMTDCDAFGVSDWRRNSRTRVELRWYSPPLNYTCQVTPYVRLLI